MEYFLTYVSPTGKQETGIAQYGQFVHALLERWAKNELSPSELLRAYESGFDKTVVSPLPEGREIAYFESGKAYFGNFQGVMTERQPEVWMAERKLVVLENCGAYSVEYVGILDLVLRLQDGRRALVDHKSSGRRSFYGAKGRERLRQLYLYSWLLLQHFGYAPDVLCFNLFREGKELCFDFSHNEYQETLFWRDRTASELLPLLHEEPSPLLWEARPIPYWCKNVCAVKDRCPEMSE